MAGEDVLDKLKREADQVKMRIGLVVRRRRQELRKLDTRTKIVIGGTVLACAKKGDPDALRWMDRACTLPKLERDQVLVRNRLAVVRRGLEKEGGGDRI